MHRRVGTPPPTPPVSAIPSPPAIGPGPSTPEWPRPLVRSRRIDLLPSVVRATSRTICVRSAATVRVVTGRPAGPRPPVSMSPVVAPVRRRVPDRPAWDRRVANPVSVNSRVLNSRPGRSRGNSVLRKPARLRRANGLRSARRRLRVRSTRSPRGGPPTTCRAATPPARTTGQQVPMSPRRVVGVRISIRLIRTGIRRRTERTRVAAHRSRTHWPDRVGRRYTGSRVDPAITGEHPEERCHRVRRPVDGANA